MSEAMSAQSLDVSAISSAMSEDDQDSDADSGFDSRRKSSGKKRKQRSLSSRFKSSIQKSRKPSLANVQEVQSDYEEDSPAARDASRANMSSDFASSGVDSNPSSPVLSSRSSKSAVDMSDSDGIGHADNTGAREVSDAVPQPEQSKPKKKRRRRGNY